MHAYVVYILLTGEDSAAVWTDFVPEAIHNPVAIKLLVSGFMTRHNMLCISVFTS